MTDITEADFLTVGLLDADGREPYEEHGYARVPIKLRWDPGSFDEVYTNVEAVTFPASTGPWGTVTSFALFIARSTNPFLKSDLSQSQYISCPGATVFFVPRSIRIPRQPLVNRYGDRRWTFPVLEHEQYWRSFDPPTDYHRRDIRYYELEWPRRPPPFDINVGTSRVGSRDLTMRPISDRARAFFSDDWNEPPDALDERTRWFAERIRHSRERLRDEYRRLMDPRAEAEMGRVRELEQAAADSYARHDAAYPPVLTEPYRNFIITGIDEGFTPSHRRWEPEEKDECFSIEPLERAAERKIVVPVPRFWGQLDRALSEPKKAAPTKDMPVVEPTPAGAEELIDWAHAHPDKQAWAGRLSIQKVTRMLKEKAGYGKSWAESDLVALAGGA